MQYVAEEFNYPIKFKLHYLGQKARKAKRPAREIPSCFPSLQHSNFKECNVPSYDKIVKQQEHLYNNNNNNTVSSDMLSIKSYLQGDWRNSMKDPIIGVQDMLQLTLNSINNENTIPFHQLQTILNDNDIVPLNIPFINVDSFCMPEFLDRYCTQIQSFFKFNYKSA